MKGIDIEREILILEAVRAVHKRSGGEIVISKTEIVHEILEHPRTYGIPITINLLRQMVTIVCCKHFEERSSSSWRNGAWLVTADSIQNIFNGRSYMSGKIKCIPCHCGADGEHLLRMEDLPAGAFLVYRECAMCGFRSAGAILSVGAIACSCDHDIVENTATDNWNQTISNLRERGEV